MYYNPSRKMRCLVHGDDFVCVGEAAELKWLETQLKERFEIEATMMGLRPGESREERILYRVIRVTDDGSEYEADQCHVDLIIRETGGRQDEHVVAPRRRQEGYRG